MQEELERAEVTLQEEAERCTQRMRDIRHIYQQDAENEIRKTKIEFDEAISKLKLGHQTEIDRLLSDFEKERLLVESQCKNEIQTCRIHCEEKIALLEKGLNEAKQKLSDNEKAHSFEIEKMKMEFSNRECNLVQSKELLEQKIQLNADEIQRLTRAYQVLEQRHTHQEALTNEKQNKLTEVSQYLAEEKSRNVALGNQIEELKQKEAELYISLQKHMESIASLQNEKNELQGYLQEKDTQMQTDFANLKQRFEEELSIEKNKIQVLQQQVSEQTASHREKLLQNESELQKLHQQIAKETVSNQQNVLRFESEVEKLHKQIAEQTASYQQKLIEYEAESQKIIPSIHASPHSTRVSFWRSSLKLLVFLLVFVFGIIVLLLVSLQRISTTPLHFMSIYQHFGAILKDSIVKHTGMKIDFSPPT